MELNFEKRYLLIYSLIIAVANYVIKEITLIIEKDVSIISLDIIVLIITLLIVSIFNREQKERVALGFFYKKTPFEKAGDYIENDKRIDSKDKRYASLKNMKNYEFYKQYYRQVADKESVIVKNSEYCILRDLTFVIFIIFILFIILTIIWFQQFWKLVIVSAIVYIISVIATRKKAKDFVLQIIIEKIK